MTDSNDQMCPLKVSVPAACLWWLLKLKSLRPHLSFHISLSLSPADSCEGLVSSLPRSSRDSAAADGRLAVTATLRVEWIFLWWNTAASSQEQQVAQPRCKSKTHPCAKSYREKSARGVAGVWKCMSNTDCIDMRSPLAFLSRLKESDK